jgi:ribonuclease BN (tRNA processing enzyme)
MKLTVLGSGVAVPNDRRTPSSYLLQGKDGNLLLDCGPCVMLRLEEAHIPFHEVDAVLLSHFHPDHCAGLIPLLFAHKVPGNPRTKSLELRGAPGMKDLIRNLERAWGDWLVPDGFERVIGEITEHDFSMAGFQIRAALGTHCASSLAYRIHEPGGKDLVYSGDTSWSEPLIRLARGAALLLLECSLPAGPAVPGHLTADQAGRLAAAAEVPRLLLTHFYPPCNLVDITAQVAQHYKGEILLAQDLMTLEI